MNYFLFLLDVAPDPVPVPKGVGITGLLLIGVVVFMVTGAILLGAVLLINKLRSGPATPTRLAGGDVRVSLDRPTAETNPQSESPH